MKGVGRIVGILGAIAGGVAYAANQWLILYALTKALPLESVGEYIYYQALLVPLSILLNFGLRNGIASDVSTRYSDQAYIDAKTVGMFALAIIGIAIVTGTAKTSVFGIAVLAAKLAESGPEMQYGAWIRKKEAYRTGVSQVLRLAICSGLFPAGLALGAPIELILAIYPVSVLLVFLLYDRRFSDFPLPRLSKSSWWSLIQVSVPLALSTFVSSLVVSVPRMIVEFKLGGEMLAVYAIALYLVSVLQMPGTTISQVAIPALAKVESRKVLSDLIFLKYFAVVALFGFVAMAFVLAFGSTVLAIAFNVPENFFDNSTLSVVAGIVLAQSIYVLFTGYVIARRKFRSLLFCSVAVVVLIALLTYMGVTYKGLTGAYVGMMATYLVGVTILVFILNRGKGDTSSDR